MKRVLTVIILALFIRTTQLLESQATTVKGSLPTVNSHSDETYIIERIQSALSSTQYGVRLYFRGACSEDGNNTVEFPLVNVLPRADKEDRGIPAVREMFRNDNDVVVSVDSSNIVRINIGSVHKSVLDTRLSSIKLPTTARYNPGGPGGTIDVLESSAPVQAAMREFGMHQEPAFYIGLEQPPLPKLPHLPPSMSDLSVDQALDTVAKTFPGVVVYGECENNDKSHTIDIKFDWYPSRE